jgi:RHS repeat-associated protein
VSAERIEAGTSSTGTTAKVQGKRDTETELDYFGARYFGAGIGIFTAVDPAMTVEANVVDPQRWNRYGYARGNPLRYVDPNGDVVRLASLGPAQRTSVLSDLNAFTGNTYNTTPAGDLTLVSRGPGSSEIATQFLDYMIGLNAVVNVRDARDPALGFNDFRLKDLDFAETLHQLGADVLLDFVDFQNLDYKGVNAATFNTGSNLVHELLHQVPGFEDPPTEALKKTTTGITVDTVNLMRAERGLPARGPGYAMTKRFDFFGLFGTGGLSLEFEGKDLRVKVRK